MTPFPAGIPGVDLYHGDNVVSFHDLQAAGIRWVYNKVSQGVTDADPTYRDRSARCSSIGLLNSGYLFFVEADPVAQAQFFIRLWQGTSGQLIPMIDVETYFPCVGKAALACAVEIKRLCGHWPILYSGDSFFGSYLKDVWPAEAIVWLARYDADPPINAHTIRQFSGSGSVPGVDGNCDLDVFNGTEEELQALVMK